MVNKRGSRYTHLNNLEDRNSYLTSENSVLKKKNDDLAKALSEARLEYQKLITTSLDLNAKIFYVNVEKINYEECLKAVSVDLQSFIAQFLTLTEQLSTILGRANFALRRYKDDSFKANIGHISPPNCTANNSKTAAIMPMISGHTISNPKINLPRVSIRQLTDMMNTSTDEENEVDENDLDDMHFNEDELNEEDELENSVNESSFPAEPRRLETMHEEAEESISSNRPQSLLSGIFRDVKVYISPLNTQNVVEFRKKSPFPRRRSTNNHDVSNQSTSRVSNVSAQNEFLTSGRSRIGESSESSMDHSTPTMSHTAPKIRNKTNNNSSEVNDDDNGFNLEEEDPLEGPSSLWNNTSNLTLKSTPTETSTPFSAKRWRKTQKDQNESKTPIRSSNFVTRRGITRSTKDSNTSTSTITSECCVRLKKLSPKTIKRLSSNLHESPRVSRRLSGKSTRDRDDSPTVLERSSHRISLQLSENRKRASTGTTESPKVRRRRKTKAITYKEPSLIKKMRR